MSNNSESLDLDPILRRLEQATPGPWYHDVYDDANCATMEVVTTRRPTPSHVGAWPNIPRDSIVAATLIQSGPSFGRFDGRFSEDADFIAHCRNDVERLVAEVRRLRDLLHDNA